MAFRPSMPPPGAEKKPEVVIGIGADPKKPAMGEDQDESREQSFKCPNCGAPLCVEMKDDDAEEQAGALPESMASPA